MPSLKLIKIRSINLSKRLFDNLVEPLLQRFKHWAIPSDGEVGNFDLIDLTSSSESIQVLCNAIFGNSKPRLLIVITPKND